MTRITHRTRKIRKAPDTEVDYMTIRVPRLSLTDIQKKYLAYIERFCELYKRYPTYHELSAHFKRARSTIFQSLNCRGLRYNSRSGLRMRQ